MTVTELRKFLEEMEKQGKGDRPISVVSCENCDPIDEGLDKWVEKDVYAYEVPGETITISD